MKDRNLKAKRALILTGDGINCELETAEACRAAGFTTEILHLSELVARKEENLLTRTSLLVLPGGFSFGDELGSGRVLSLKIRHELGWDLAEYARAGGVVLGICNGFQALVALGVFGTGVALASNRDGRFINRWSKLTTAPLGDRGALFEGIHSIELPIRHGEGRLLFSVDLKGMELGEDRLAALRYEGENPNGSFEAIAGLVDTTGRILGLMPHPEGFQKKSQHPGFFKVQALAGWQAPSTADEEGAGLKIFRNAFEIAQER